jgi:hypothetical protein
MPVCYVDFQKAYDSVNRELLWEKMRSMGYGGWIIDACTALYAYVPMCVKASRLHHMLPISGWYELGIPTEPQLVCGLFVDHFEEHILKSRKNTSMLYSGLAMVATHPAARLAKRHQKARGSSRPEKVPQAHCNSDCCQGQ